MGSAQNGSGGSWLLDYGVCDEVWASDFIWAPQIGDDPMVSRWEILIFLMYFSG